MNGDHLTNRPKKKKRFAPIKNMLNIYGAIALSSGNWDHDVSRRPMVTGGLNLEEFDCGYRKLAYDYGKSLMPRHGEFSALHSALGLDVQCNGTVLDAKAPSNPEAIQAPKLLPIPESALYVDYEVGSDSTYGSISSPLKTIQAAIDIIATRPIADRTIVLRGGTHYLNRTIYLGPEHSHIRLTALQGESPVVSGGKKIDVTWRKVATPNASQNIYVSSVAGQVTEVPGLQLDGKRATRARFPNLPAGIEASCGYGCMIAGRSGHWTHPDPDRFGPVTFYTDSNPVHDRNDTAKNWFKHYMIGVNGLCSVYTPSVSYWCSEHPSGGGAFAFRTPVGVIADKTVLPNSPYKDPSSLMFFVWRPARWANWMFETAKVEGDNYTFGAGGFQGARGDNDGGDFFVENVKEELDYPGEFFYDKKEQNLYLYYNGTGAPPADMEVVVPQKQVLLNASGTQWRPITNVHLEGITYTASEYTYMMPHGVPSAGIHHIAADEPSLRCPRFFVAFFVDVPSPTSHFYQATGLSIGTEQSSSKVL